MISPRILQEIRPTALPCSGEETWQHGSSLLNYMKLVELEGLTGRIKFDLQGLRTDFLLDIVQLRRRGLEKVIPGLQATMYMINPF